MSNNKLKITIASVFLFIIFSFYSYSDICCMFGATRYYGWPFSFISLNKTVETYEEASRIKTDWFWNLKKDGWEFSFSANPISPKPFQAIALNNPVIGMVFDVGLSFLLVWGINKIYKKFLN